MDLREYIDVLRRRWRFVVACVLLGLGAAVAVTALTPRTYTAKAQLFIATNDKDSSNAYAGSLFTEQRVKSYTKIANSPAVLEGVIAKLHLRTTPEQLARKISAEAPLDTTLVDIRVQERSALRAQAIADETAVQFTKYIDSIEKGATNAPPLVKASVLSDPRPPSSPTSPRPALNLAIGALAGLVVGVSGAVLRQSLDSTVRSADDVRRRLGLATVAALPKPPRHRAPSGHIVGTTPRDEAMNQLRTRLRFSTDGRSPSSLVVAGPLPGEGRTETAVDLAANVARTGQNVVLVEGDLRRPRLAKTLGLPHAPGLTEVLTGTTPLSDALQDWGNGLMRVLTAGTPPPDPAAVLSSRSMTQLLRGLEADCDLVIVDSPPLLPYADAAILASEAEAVLLVIRLGKVSYEAVRRALESLASVHARVLGAVLTGLPAEKFAHQGPDGRPTRQSGPPAPRRKHSPEPEADGTPVSTGVGPSVGRHP